MDGSRRVNHSESEFKIGKGKEMIGKTMLRKNKKASGIHRMICGDTGTRCDAVFEGRNDDRIVLQAVEHLTKYHNFSLSVALAAQVRELIKTV